MVDAERTARWGIQASYEDALGQPRAATVESIDHVIAALDRGEGRDEPSRDDGPVFVPLGTTALPARVAGHILVLEDGTDLGPVDDLPPDLPPGLHSLRAGDTAALLVVHPTSCWRPDDLRAWGWALQLHADRSARSWGHGDLSDAAAIGRWSREQGGGHPVLLLSPLHAPNLVGDIQPSPYFASSRCFRNPLYLRIADVPGAEQVDLTDLDASGRALNDERTIDRTAVWAFKQQALERIWAVAGDPTASGRTADPVLDAFAAFTTALGLHGDDWRRWPADLRHPSGAGWAALVAEHRGRVGFHRWVQHLVGDQLAATEAAVPLVHDLAIGTDPAGFDAWYWQDLFVLDGTRIGAPPDQFNTLGQDWNLPPLDPWRARRAGFEPFIRMLRAALAHGSGLRIDHVMGLFRQFWIPPGAHPRDGLYVRLPAPELLALVALESQRAEAFVVGEDLGTVEPGVREALAAQRVLSYRVLELDDTPVDHYPVEALASFTTHDLPTLVGFWTGSDLADQERLGLEPNVEDTRRARARFAAQIGADGATPFDDVSRRAHALLAGAPSRIVAAQLEDAIGVAERPNMPGTVDEWPNWSLALPELLEAVLDRPLTGEIPTSWRIRRSNLTGSVTPMGDATRRWLCRRNVGLVGLVGLVLAATLAVTATPAGGVPASADVSVTMTRSPSNGQALIDPITFTAVVHNAGPSAAQDVVLVDPLNQLFPIVDEVTTTRGTCDTSEAQILCTIGTLASGANATVTVVMRPYQSGLVTNTVAVTTTTPDPDSENDTASASVVLTQPPTYEELTVIGYFKVVLGLDATDDQIERWTAELGDVFDLQDFALKLLKTYTFRSHWVDETYQKLLGRPADAGGLATFTRALSQRWTYEQVTATIAGSGEYRNRFPNARGFVDQLVEDLTGAPPSTAFRRELLQRLLEGQSPATVAYRVATSGDARVAWVKEQFQRYCGRDATSLDVYFNVSALYDGNRPARVLANILSSLEVIRDFLPGF